MATARFLFSSILTDECDGSVIASSMASNSLGAPEEMQKSFNFSGAYIHIGSFEATVNSWYTVVLRFSSFFLCYSLKNESKVKNHFHSF